MKPKDKRSYVLKVIRSCRTVTQVQQAHHWARNINFASGHFSYMDLLRDRCQEQIDYIKKLQQPTKP